MGKVIEQLGIAEAMADKIIHRPALEGGVELIASGEAEIGIYPASEVVDTEGLERSSARCRAGIDLTIVYGAAVTADSRSSAMPAPPSSHSWSAPEHRAVWAAGRLSIRRASAQVRLMLSSPPRRPTSALAPIASTNSTISIAYMRGMSKVL